MKLEELVVVEEGMRFSLVLGNNVGLDVPSGGVEILGVDTLDTNDSKDFRDEVKRYINPIMITMSDILNESSDSVRAMMDELLTLREGDWVTFRYLDEELAKSYVDITLPYVDFIKLIDRELEA